MSVKAIVLDFDGTMCLLFKNFDLSDTVHTMHTKMMEYNIDFSMELDAFDVFETILSQTQDGYLRINALQKANEILTEAEVKAVDSCELVPGLIEVIEEFHKAGIALGVSSNNSEDCIKKITNKFFPDIPFSITGRVGTNPRLMKPNSWSLKETLAKLSCCEEDTIFVGDTQRDYTCSEDTKCSFIGMAPTARKRERLLRFLQKDKIMADYYELRDYIEELLRC